MISLIRIIFRVCVCDASAQLLRDTHRQQKALDRDLAGVCSQQQRFVDEIRRKQQQVFLLR